MTNHFFNFVAQQFIYKPLKIVRLDPFHNFQILLEKINYEADENDVHHTATEQPPRI